MKSLHAMSHVLFLAAAIAIAALPSTAAANGPPLPPGFYTLMMPSKANQPAKNGCLIQNNNGTGGPVRYDWKQPYGIFLYCGFASEQAFIDNGQALFKLIYTHSLQSTGERVYVLQNKRSGQCLQVWPGSRNVFFSASRCGTSNANSLWILDTFPGGGGYRPPNVTSLRPLSNPTFCLIYGNNGHDTVPALWRWTDVSSDRVWCGLGSYNALSNTGQGLFLMYKMAE